MIDINLLPPEYGPKKAVKLINLVIISLSFLICLSLLLSSLKLLTAVQDYSVRIDYHENQIEHYKRQVEDINRLAQKVKLLKTRLSLVQGLLQEQDPWSHKLVELSQCLPSYGAWMDTITIERQDSKTSGRSGNSEIAGTEPVIAYVSAGVVSIDKITQFVANLEDSSTFGTVIFDSANVKPDVIGNDTIMDFKLSVAVPPSGTGL